MKVGLNVSLSLDINSSIVQGSGIGPSLFVVYISDLKASGKDNCIIKFADDVLYLCLEQLIILIISLHPSQCQRKSTHIRHVDLKSTMISQKCIKTVTEEL